MTLKSFGKSFAFGALAMAAASVSGCGLDDIQLNGKIFDAVGINNTGSVKKEAKVRERQPLIVPPGLEQLPQPGTGATAQAGDIEGLQDHDAKRTVNQAQLEKQQAEYCKVNYEQATQRGDNNADLATGPLGPCRGSVMSVVKKMSGSDNAEEAQ